MPLSASSHILTITRSLPRKTPFPVTTKSISPCCQCAHKPEVRVGVATELTAFRPSLLSQELHRPCCLHNPQRVSAGHPSSSVREHNLFFFFFSPSASALTASIRVGCSKSRPKSTACPRDLPGAAEGRSSPPSSLPPYHVNKHPEGCTGFTQTLQSISNRLLTEGGQAYTGTGVDI